MKGIKKLCSRLQRMADTLESQAVLAPILEMRVRQKPLVGRDKEMALKAKKLLEQLRENTAEMAAYVSIGLDPQSSGDPYHKWRERAKPEKRAA